MEAHNPNATEGGIDNSIYIGCVGIDNLYHVCKPESKLTQCGIAVKRKKLLRDDHCLYGCYECTY